MAILLIDAKYDAGRLIAIVRIIIIVIAIEIYDTRFSLAIVAIAAIAIHPVDDVVIDLGLLAIVEEPQGNLKDLKYNWRGKKGGER